MNVSQIIKGLTIEIALEKDFEVQGITDDSREVEENFIFFALKGISKNGNDYIDQAIARGAKLIFSENHFINENIQCIKVKNGKEILSILLERFYNMKPEKIVAVTGTNGKSSIVHFFKMFIELLKQSSASIGTLGVDCKSINFPEKLHQITTPSASELHKILNALKAVKVDYVAIEASSHGLEQGRINNIKFEAAAFASFALDHLDYHKTRTNYFNSKLKLFTEILQPGDVAVINNDMENEYLHLLYNACTNRGLKILKYGKSLDSDLKIIKIKKESNFQELTIQFQNKIYSGNINLIGEFQIYNLLAAIGLTMAVGFKFEDIWLKINDIIAAKGRMKKVQHSKLKGEIFIDYAHTADALEYILKDMKQYTKGKLKILFGCGGGKDPNRRFSMGGIANKYADEVYITDDNPRDEDPALIRSQIIKFCPKAIEISDRKDAINQAVKSMKNGDILIISGKGHENYHIVKGVKSFFSDEEEVIKSL